MCQSDFLSFVCAQSSLGKSFPNIHYAKDLILVTHTILTCLFTWLSCWLMFLVHIAHIGWNKSIYWQGQHKCMEVGAKEDVCAWKLTYKFAFYNMARETFTRPNIHSSTLGEGHLLNCWRSHIQTHINQCCDFTKKITHIHTPKWHNSISQGMLCTFVHTLRPYLLFIFVKAKCSCILAHICRDEWGSSVVVCWLNSIHLWADSAQCVRPTKCVFVCIRLMRCGFAFHETR